MRKATYACLLVGLVCLIGSCNGDPSDIKTCEECIANSKTWIEDINCDQKCAVVSGYDTNISLANWRRRVVNVIPSEDNDKNTYDSCEVMKNTCEVLDGIQDPSFEVVEKDKFPWTTSTGRPVISKYQMTARQNPPILSRVINLSGSVATRKTVQGGWSRKLTSQKTPCT